MENQPPQPADYEINLEDLVNKPANHNWTDRGAVVTCEGAGHPPHRHYKVTPIA